MKYYYCCYQLTKEDGNTTLGWGVQANKDQFPVANHFKIKEFIENICKLKPEIQGVILTFWKEITAEEWTELKELGLPHTLK